MEIGLEHLLLDGQLIVDIRSSGRDGLVDARFTATGVRPCVLILAGFRQWHIGSYETAVRLLCELCLFVSKRNDTIDLHTVRASRGYLTASK